MRTTVRLDEELLRAAKEHASRTGRTLTALLEDALRVVLALEQRPRSRSRIKLPTFDGGGLQRGVNLDSAANLLDVMEDRGAAR